MNFTNKDIFDLRARTGVGVMDCKKALIEADGDMDKAVELLREKGKATSEKRAGKIASQGIVSTYINGNVGVIVEVNCESDFVARGDQYKDYVNQVAKYIAENDVKDVEELTAALSELTSEVVAKIGEKISIRRFEKYVSSNKLSDYIHMGGAIGVLVETEGASDEVAHDVALQIAAAAPRYIAPEEVPADEVNHEKEILLAQAMNDEKNANKPKEILEKMIQGKIGKFYKEVCLLEQPFVKDQGVALKSILNGAKVLKFTRLVMGEGLEKKEENLQDEVAAQIAAAKKN
ncbi:MAG: elongation factor Ts [Clostridiales bacterium]|nr:elongation factor Ts [Clostridiales bacterium]